MKKKILLACLFAIISTTSAYCACDGGTTITNTAGSTFCKSNTYMNWWSAQAWCQANGFFLANIYDMCPSWDGTSGTDRCPELKDKSSGKAWSSTAYGDKYAYYVVFSDGQVSMFSRNEGQHTNFTAFCRFPDKE